MDPSTGRNDVSWYARNPLLLRAAGSIPFPYRPGMTVPWATMSGANAEQTWRQYSIPGVMTFKWRPTVGYSATATDPASIVGKEMFAKVREKFSGSIDADAPDFVIYIMALDSVFSYIASLKRIYRILTAYTAENHYIPDTLLKAMGIPAASVVDLKEHRMQFYQIINELVYMTRKFNVPAVFDMFNRHYWMNDNVYMDDNTINSQFYVFYANTYYQYSLVDVGDVKAGGLIEKSLSWPLTDVSEYLFTFGRNLIDALAGSDDAYIISGYLMRAYEGNPVFGVDELTMDEKLVPLYEPEVLMQIENAMPIVFNNTTQTPTITNSVTQDPSTNAVICTPRASVTINSPEFANQDWTFENFVTIRSDMPTVADVTIATRLKMGWSNLVVNPSTGATTFDIICGSEILEDICITTIIKNSNDTPTSNNIISNHYSGINVINTANPVSDDELVSFALMQSFDWHPTLGALIFRVQTSGAKKVNPVIMGDVHNVTLLTNEQLKQLNRVCLYSEFNAYGQI